MKFLKKLIKNQAKDAIVDEIKDKAVEQVADKVAMQLQTDIHGNQVMVAVQENISNAGWSIDTMQNTSKTLKTTGSTVKNLYAVIEFVVNKIIMPVVRVVFKFVGWILANSFDGDSEKKPSRISAWESDDDYYYYWRK